jgi:hypothetical protein
MTDGPGDSKPSGGGKPGEPGEKHGEKRHLGDQHDQKTLGAAVVVVGFVATILTIVSTFAHGSLATALWTLGIALLVAGGGLVLNRIQRRRWQVLLVVLVVVLVVLLLILRGILSHTRTVKHTTLPHPSQSARSQPAKPTPSTTPATQCPGGATPGTGRPRLPFASLSTRDGYPAYWVAYSPDGKWLAVSSDNVDWTNPPLNKGGSLSLWDVECPAVAARHLVTNISDPQTKGVWQAAFSRDGKYLAAADGNHTTYVWDISKATPQLIAQLPDPQDADIAMIEFGVNDALFTADINGGAYEWDILTQLSTGSFVTGQPGLAGLDSMAISPDGHTLAIGYSSGNISLWNIAKDSSTTLSTPGGTSATAVAFGGHDGDILAAGGLNGQTYLWDLSNHGLVATLPSGTGQQVNTVTFNPAGTILAVATATASGNNTGYGHVYLWNAVSHSSLGTMQYSGETAVFGLAFSPDGDTLATSDYGARAYLWNATWLARR